MKLYKHQEKVLDETKKGRKNNEKKKSSMNLYASQRRAGIYTVKYAATSRLRRIFVISMM